jgi:hypothetical protein
VIAPITLTGSLLLTQLFLFLIIFVGIYFLAEGEKNIPTFSDHYKPVVGGLLMFVLFIFLLTEALLLFSSEFVQILQPAFGDLLFPKISTNDAFICVFLIDIIGASILVRRTGGSKDSPFAAILFSIPPIAIFLHESPPRFLGYTFLSAILFLISIDGRGVSKKVLENENYALSFNVVTIGCLSISTFVGYVTRPV